MARNLYWIEWLKHIEKSKKKYEVPTIDAKIDTDGFIIPGYSGLKINIEKSLSNLDKLGQWDEKCLVLEEIEPHVGISNLIPAPIRQGNNNKPMISFIINIPGHNDKLLEVINILREHKIKSTFFIEGTWAHKFPILAQKIRDDGHEIGNGTYSYPDLRGMTMEGIRWELTKTNEIIRKELGIRPKLFTPPKGEYDERVIYMAALERMNTVLSTIHTLEPKEKKATESMKKTISNLEGGKIISLNPMDTSISDLLQLLKNIEHRQYKIGKLSELLSVRHV
ncbi:MAG: polysaccharide deacetylase family protein [Bacillota bacterium]|nr:polysaccharide deacetylase family protein [Bacillota bacterium]